VRLFLDANVLFAAAHSPNGRARALFRLAEAGCCTLLASEHAISEARRNLLLKSPQGSAELDGLLARLGRVAEAGPRSVAKAGERGLPDNDAPILAAAVAAGADLLVTGDRTHFGHLFGTEIGGVRVVSLAQGLEVVLDA
jgi:predicted nucleic acid-binding protein